MKHPLTRNLLVLKNKKKTYKLLVIVIGVWGYIGYQIFDALNPSLPEYAQATPVFKDNFKYNTQVDTFSIQKVNRDPFLGTIYRPKSNTKTRIQKTPKSVWPPIAYLGVIANKNNKDKVFIITVNNRQILLKKGKSQDSIKAIRGDSKKIILQYKGRNKTFKIKS